MEEESKSKAVKFVISKGFLSRGDWVGVRDLWIGRCLPPNFQKATFL